jgi:hypothetical protein
VKHKPDGGWRELILSPRILGFGEMESPRTRPLGGRAQPGLRRPHDAGSRHTNGGRELINVSSPRGGLFALTSDARESGAGYIPQKVAIQDCSFLFGILLLSGLSYLGRLGFYADDWFVWAVFYGAKNQSLGGLLHNLLPIGLGVRPVQALYQAFTYFNFGLHPLPYHLTNTLLLAGTAVLFYASLRELQLHHCITLAVPLVYELLPHYATDRFWIAAHQAVLSQLFFFLGLYTALRAVRGGRTCSFCLKAVSILSFAFALLSYEVIVGLLPASFLLIGYRAYTKRSGSGEKPRTLIFPGLGYFLVTAVCLGLILLYKATVTSRVSFPFQHPSSTYIGELVWNVVKVSIRFNMLQYGVGLPRAAFKLYRFSGAGAWPAIIAGVIAFSVLLYLNWTFRRSRSAILSRNGTLCLIAAGFVVFVLDYVPFVALVSNFSTDGMSNRVTIAAAIGPACVLVGGTILLIRAVVPTKLQSLSFCGAIAAICVLNYVCIASFAECWAKAYILQREIVLEVRKNVNLSPGSTLLLDGYCRYVGPAPVLENWWDASGALRVAYADDTLRADVVSPNLEISDDAIRTTYYGRAEGRYIYGVRFWLHNVRRKVTLQLIDSLVARSYLRTMNPDKNSGCPVAADGIGSPIP